jgi:DNA-binding response OmpR family regulator
LPNTQRFYLGWSALGKVLILAREEVVAALLGLMVELRGLEPMYLAKADIAEDAIRRERPEVVVIDCDHRDCTDTLLAAVKESGAKPILFSPFRFESDVRRVAARHGADSFTLPTDPESFGRMLRA